MVFQNVEPEIWKHEKEGDSVEGFYLAMQEDVGKYKSNAYKLESKGGERWLVFGNNVLDDQMQFAKFGDLIRIVFKGKAGEESKGKQKYNVYELQIDDGKGKRNEPEPISPRH